MKIAIIGAMEEEVLTFKHKLKNYTTLHKGGCDIYIGELHGITIALLKSGVGKTAAAIGTTLLLNHFPADLIINTGAAGGLNHQLNVGDIVISTAVIYHDVDLTGFKYKLGQMAGCPVQFEAAEQYVTLATSCAQTLKLTAFHGLICSGDSFINSKSRRQYILHHFKSSIAVEMEAGAIAQTCYRFNVPFVVIRSISDVADKISHLSFNDFLPLAVKNSSQLVDLFIKKLSGST